MPVPQIPLVYDPKFRAGLEQATTGNVASPNIMAQSQPVAQVPSQKPANVPGFSPGEMQQMLADLEKKEIEGLEAERKEVSNLQNKLQDLDAKDLPTDLSGIASLVDAWTGSNFAASYRPPETKKEREAQKAMLQSSISNAQRGISQTEMDQLRSQLNTATQMGNTALGAANLEEDKRQFNANQELEKKKLARADTKPTKAQQVVDSEFGKLYADDVISGGLARADLELQNLDQLQKDINEGKYGQISGPKIGALEGKAKALAFPQAAAAQQQIEKVVQASMKATLGAQFTEKEGQQVLQRTFDPSLPQAENQKRLDALLKSLQATADAKKKAYKYFEENGTMRGYVMPNLEETFKSGLSNSLDSGMSREEKIKTIMRRRGEL